MFYFFLKLVLVVWDMARFATVTESDIDAIVEDKNAASTKKATETLFNVLLSYRIPIMFEFCLDWCYL